MDRNDILEKVAAVINQTGYENIKRKNQLRNLQADKKRARREERSARSKESLASKVSSADSKIKQSARLKGTVLSSNYSAAKDAVSKASKNPRKSRSDIISDARKASKSVRLDPKISQQGEAGRRYIKKVDKAFNKGAKRIVGVAALGAAGALAMKARSKYNGQAD